jgi:hypothetical protein
MSSDSVHGRLVAVIVSLFFSSPVVAQTSARDSAGIRIVTSSPTRPGRNYSLDTAPVFRVSSEAMMKLARRVTDVVGNARGSVVLFDSEKRQFAVVDSTGKHLRTVGRLGKGPGEFDHVAGYVFTDGDSLIVMESGGRVTVLRPDGTVARIYSLSLRSGISTATLLAVLGDDRLVVAIDGPSIPPRAGEPGLNLRSAHLLLVRPGSSSEDTLLTTYSSEMFVRNSKGRNGEVFYMGTPYLFGRKLLRVGDPSTLYIGDGATFEIRQLSADGRTRRLIRLASPPREFTARMNEHLDETLNELDLRDRSVFPHPKVVPAFEKLLLDPDRRLWVQEFLAPGDAQITWRIFGAAGELIGTLVVPPNLDIRGAGRGTVTALRKDRDGMEELVIYRYR